MNILRIVTVCVVCALTLKADAADLRAVLVEQNVIRIDLTGQINGGDGVAFKVLALGLIREGYEIGSVALASPGGVVADSIAIGEQVRELRATTIAPSGTYERPVCDHLNQPVGQMDCLCASGCFFIWAGGQARRGSVLGTHRARYLPGYFKTLGINEARAKQDESIHENETYLKTMGIPDSIIRRGTLTASIDMYYLKRWELELLTGQPPYIQELQQARCEPGWVFKARLDCAEQVLREDRKAGTEAYLKKYR